MKKKTLDQFIKDAKTIHGDKYDYSKVNYVNDRTKVCIICKEHGEFLQTPNNHLKGKGCPKCYGSEKKTSEQFIQDAIKIHGDKYDYSKVDYVNAKTKVIIVCPEHGDFKQTPNNHLKGKGCLKCQHEKLSWDRRKSAEQFIEEAKSVHGDKYDYSKVKYVNNRTKVVIICKKCGTDFLQIPSDHLQGRHGCPHCNKSKGESKIEQYFIEHNINFEPQKRFKDCRNKEPLPFDFYLPDYNLCIEFQGRQHTEPVEAFGGEEGLRLVQFNDAIKKDWCHKEENPNLLEINYTEFNNIEQILKEKIL